MATEKAPQRIEHAGRPASPGLARGPVVVLTEEIGVAAASGSPEEERARLALAMANAAVDLGDLVTAQHDSEAADILDFQLALLEDEALTEGAYADIASGSPALGAWSAAMDAMVAEYRAAEDDYFRARASDIEDLASRVTGHLTGAPTGALSLPPGAILLARDLTPSRFLATDWSEGRAVALTEGSPTAHVAILARSRGVPMVVGLGRVDADGHSLALLDGSLGTLLLSPTPADEAVFARRRKAARGEERLEAAVLHQPAITADGRSVRVLINVGDPTELDGLDAAICDGIGLVRTEFLFHDRGRLPGEDEQLAAYRRLLDWAGTRPVVIRTLDAGGDKPVAGLTREESNPFLGLRGVRLSLARTDVFRVQVRALLRAAVSGSLMVMVPMVALPWEMSAVRELFEAEADALRAAGLDHAMPSIGMMVEVPSAAMTLDLFDTDFVSIGSNDLTQYVLAASREAGDLGPGLDDAGGEAVQRLIALVIEQGRSRNIPVSLCGDAGGDPAVLPKLLASGLASVSVAPAAVGRVKRLIAGWSEREHGRG
jgi:phosphoenolpyruvate-protein phosphotransferase (PTS system enzyme I)